MVAVAPSVAAALQEDFDMRVFDFDNTIYDGESIFDIFLYFLKKDTGSVIKIAPKFIKDFIRYKLDKITVEEAMQSYGDAFKKYCMKYDNIFEEFEKFWDLNQHKIKSFYPKLQREDDIVVSGCPECLLSIICKRIGIKHFIGSDIDPVKGEINHINYKDKKIIAFRKVYGDVIIDDFYTDSMADKPMMDISKNVFMVRDDKITQIKKDGITI